MLLLQQELEEFGWKLMILASDAAKQQQNAAAVAADGMND